MDPLTAAVVEERGELEAIEAAALDLALEWRATRRALEKRGGSLDAHWEATKALMLAMDEVEAARDRYAAAGRALRDAAALHPDALADAGR